MESKELKNIIKAINEYCKKYKNNVNVICSVMAFKGKECKVFDDRILVMGFNDILRLDLKELDKEIKKEKGDFIVW